MRKPIQIGKNGPYLPDAGWWSIQPIPEHSKFDLLVDQWGDVCSYCGIFGGAETLDHVIPRSRGGIDTGNVVLCCRACNSDKGSMHVLKWLASLKPGVSTRNDKWHRMKMNREAAELAAFRTRKMIEDNNRRNDALTKNDSLLRAILDAHSKWEMPWLE